MNITKFKPVSSEPTTIPLRSVPGGSVFRFVCDDPDTAIQEHLFFIRLEAPEIKGDRVRVANLYDGKQLERDDCHKVVMQSCNLMVTID